jgi:hypothetical protein
MLDITTGEVTGDLNDLLARESAAAVEAAATPEATIEEQPTIELDSTGQAPTDAGAATPEASPAKEAALKILAEAQSAAEKLRARLDSEDEVRLADVMPPAESLPEPAPTSRVNALLDITANTFVRLFSSGSNNQGTATPGLEFEELTLGDTRDPTVARMDEQFLEQVRSLRPGAWLELRREDGAMLQVRLTQFDESRSRLSFADRHGHAIAQRSLQELAMDFSRGSARLIAEPAGMLDRAFTRLLDPSTWRGRNR